MQTPPKIIVFGPTGDVASVAARVAHQQGAKVFLAMRDTQKAIPGLSSAQETAGGFERVPADLTKPDTVASAVKQTGATTAFMYMAWEAKDHMRATFEASKAAGIQFLVFLSSFTIPAEGPLDHVQPEHRIPYMHARAEMELNAVYGPECRVALRPGYFAANTRMWREGIQAGEIHLDNPNEKCDCITPVDMGSVAGTILANGQRNGRNIVYLYGPQLMTLRDALKIAITALGKRARTAEDTEKGADEGSNSQDVAVSFVPQDSTSDWLEKAFDNFEEGGRNVRDYTGQPGMSYRQWVEENKDNFDV